MKKWLNSAGHALRGVISLFKTERNARIEFVIALVTIAISIWLEISLMEWCLILFCIGAVLSAEALNTSIERLANIHTRDHHPDIGALKDIAAGGVLIIGIVSVVIGICIFGPKLMMQFSH